MDSEGPILKQDAFFKDLSLWYHSLVCIFGCPQDCIVVCAVTSVGEI